MRVRVWGVETFAFPACGRVDSSLCHAPDAAALDAILRDLLRGELPSTFSPLGVRIRLPIPPCAAVVKNESPTSIASQGGTRYRHGGGISRIGARLGG